MCVYIYIRIYYAHKISHPVPTPLFAMYGMPLPPLPTPPPCIVSVSSSLNRLP